MEKRITTLVYLLKEDEICLAMKKRGFGAGNWNGYGGKVERGESVEEAAIREVEEESGVTFQKDELEKVAEIEFFLEDGTHILAHTFFVKFWDGEPTETEEMAPRWYAFDMIPYDLMWADDIHWLPRALSGEKLRGKVHFENDGQSIRDMEWKNVEVF